MVRYKDAMFRSIDNLLRYRDAMLQSKDDLPHRVDATLHHVDELLHRVDAVLRRRNIASTVSYETAIICGIFPLSSFGSSLFRKR